MKGKNAEIHQADYDRIYRKIQCWKPIHGGSRNENVYYCPVSKGETQID